MRGRRRPEPDAAYLPMPAAPSLWSWLVFPCKCQHCVDRQRCDPAIEAVPSAAPDNKAICLIASHSVSVLIMGRPSKGNKPVFKQYGRFGCFGVASERETRKESFLPQRITH